MHFLAVRVDVPDTVNGRRERGFMGFGGGEEGGAEREQGAGESGIFDLMLLM